MLYEESEKFIKDVFWQSSHNKDNKLNIIDVVHSKLIKDNQEKDPEYYARKEGVVHVSSLSKCLRGVVLEMLGAKKDNEADARKLGVFKAGNLFEDFIVDALGDKMLDRQTEYIYKLDSGLILTGRDDGTVFHEGIRTVLENKSVHTDSFWHREKEGTLVATHNQMQIQTYLWLRRICPSVWVRNNTEIIYTNLDYEELKQYKGEIAVYQSIEKPDNSELNGIFCYISKDDCMIAQAPVKFNKEIIVQCVWPALMEIQKGYLAKDATIVPVPHAVVFGESRGQYQKNWLCTYCDYHNQCVGSGWVLEANAEVTRKNKEMSRVMVNPYKEKSSQPMIGVDLGSPDGDNTVMVVVDKGDVVKIVSDPINLRSIMDKLSDQS